MRLKEQRKFFLHPALLPLLTAIEIKIILDEERRANRLTKITDATISRISFFHGGRLFACLNHCTGFIVKTKARVLSESSLLLQTS